MSQNFFTETLFKNLFIQDLPLGVQKHTVTELTKLICFASSLAIAETLSPEDCKRLSLLLQNGDISSIDSFLRSNNTLDTTSQKSIEEVISLYQSHSAPKTG